MHTEKANSAAGRKASESKRFFDHTVRGTALAIVQMEADLGLLRDNSYGPFARLVWEASRFGLHTKLKQRLVEHQLAHTSSPSYRQMDPFRLVRWATRLFILAFENGWILAPRRREWLVLQNRRRRLRKDNVYDDVYTDELVGQIPRRRRVLLEHNYLWSHQTPTRHRVWYTDTSYFIMAPVTPIVRLLIGSDLRKVGRMSRAVSDYLRNVLDIQLDLTSEWRQIAIRIAQSRIADTVMLSWLRPQKLMLVCSYGKEPLLLAAKRLGIPSVEVQHGVVTPDHLGYSFPDDPGKTAFPDYMLLFGEYWKRTVPWPIPPERLITIGYPFFEQIRAETETTMKKRRVIFISQGTIGARLSRFAVDLAASLHEDVEIVYKLHPGEIARWRTFYPWLKNGAAKGLLTVVDGQHPTLYELLASARWQIGVYSTAIFEGIALGCSTYLVDLPGIEYMESLIQSGAARLVRNPAEVDWSSWDASVDPDDFFARDWRRNFRQFLAMPLSLETRRLSRASERMDSK